VCPVAVEACEDPARFQEICAMVGIARRGEVRLRSRLDEAAVDGSHDIPRFGQERPGESVLSGRERARLGEACGKVRL